MEKGASHSYLPALDGLRALSILLVVVSHAGGGLEKIVPGTLGVIIFFVLSGFLITRQMIKEIEDTGTLNWRRFYWRRVLRLLPALLAYLAIFVPLLLCLGADITGLHISSGLFYFANYYHLFTGYPPYSPMPVLWSLSVEEHYYIMFPFLLLFFRRNLRSAIVPFCTLLGVILLWRLYLYAHCTEYMLPICGREDRIRTQGSDAILDCILYGAVAALLQRYYYPMIHRFLKNHYTVLLAGLMLLLCLLIRSPFFRETLRYSMESLSVAILLLQLLSGKKSGPREWLEKKHMVFLGKLSYALYLMHFGVLITMEKLQGSMRLEGMENKAFYFVFSFLLAYGCYTLIEKPMAEFRHRFSYRMQNKTSILAMQAT